MKGHKNLTIVIKLGMRDPGLFLVLWTDDTTTTGTSSIVDENSHEPILSILGLIVETAVQLRKDGNRVVIVSSGAVGMGMRRMDVEKKPKDLPSIQVLVQCYNLFSRSDQKTYRL